MPELTILSENLRKLRQRMSESQIKFAANCGISTEELSLLEREKSDPKLSTLQKVSAYAGITVSELLKREGDEK